MGSKNSKKDDMPKELRAKVLLLFSLIDTDNSKSIDYQETLKFWENKYAIINAQELFQSVDKDNSGSIEEEEWLEFWYNVYKSGHSKEDIMAEVIIINIFII